MLERDAGEARALTAADLERAIAFLRAPRVARGKFAASLKSGETGTAQAGLVRRQAEADARLQAVLRLYDVGDKAAALAALAEFRQSFPQHPVSELLNQPQP
jgi:hypothetical protein